MLVSGVDRQQVIAAMLNIPSPMSLKYLSRLILGVMVATAALFATLGSISYYETRRGKAAWLEYYTSHDRNNLLYSQTLAALGYGGFIHDFKNYVLRGGDDRFNRIQRHGGTTLSLIEQMRMSHSDPAELAALDGIESVVLSYLEQLGLANNLHQLGQHPEEIDGQVKVNDTPAVEGLHVLLGTNTDTNSKVSVLLQLRHALGYGGLVHQVKNYVIRKDAPRAEKISSQLIAAQNLVTTYQDLATRPEERRALETLSALLTTMSTAVDQVTTLSGQGADAKAIDGSVKWDDGPALQALLDLDRAILDDVTADAAGLTSYLEASEHISLALSILLVLILPLLAFLTYRNLHRTGVVPARAISDAMSRLAEGDTSVDTSAQVAETEIGQIAAASEAFRAAFLKNEDMSRKARSDAETQRQMAEEASAMMARQAELQTEVASKAQFIQREVTSVANAARDLANRTEKQAATVETSVCALEELTASVEAVAGSAQSAQAEMDHVGEVTEICRAILAEAISGMDAIVTSSNEVSKVTEVIEQIAFQTNLLALNAGVEAARAGEAGRGFAVVATEVLALAQRSAESASEIKSMIATSTDEIENGSAKITKAGQSFSEIADMISAVRSLADSVAHSTKEQSDGLKSLNASMSELDQVTQHNAAMFEETTASTETLLQNVEDLLAASQAVDPDDSQLAPVRGLTTLGPSRLAG